MEERVHPVVAWHEGGVDAFTNGVARYATVPPFQSDVFHLLMLLGYRRTVYGHDSFGQRRATAGTPIWDTCSSLSL